MLTTRPLVLALTLAVVASAQHATESQPPKWDRDAIVAHLGSAARDDIAWAAWLVRRDGMKSTVPQLRAALARLTGDDGLEGQLARLQVLDTLIELKVALPGEELLPHAVGLLRMPALALAARAPRLNTAYFQTRFDALDKKRDAE